jgi:UPF0755 protein
MPRVARQLKTTVAVICAALALAGMALGLIGFKFWLFLKSPGSPHLETRQVVIRSGMNAGTIAWVLSAEGVIADADNFHLLCLLRKADQKLKAGEYAFLPLSTPGQILDQMVSGKALIQRVTLPEGSTAYDISRTLYQKGLASEKEIMRLVLDRDFIKSNGLNVSSLEGYLFPETYFLERIQGEDAMLKMMVRQFWRHLPEAWEARAAELGHSLHEIVIMASMVEKEAVIDAERPIIAGVFFNRLKEKMPLQSDPTVVYDLADFSGQITRNDLRRQSPYNTYRNLGLPVGPICNPGAKSLKAALYPEKVPYLYFVSNHDGSHQFSQTLAEHNQAVARSHQRRKDPEPRARAEGFNSFADQWSHSPVK